MNDEVGIVEFVSIPSDVGGWGREGGHDGTQRFF